MSTPSRMFGILGTGGGSGAPAELDTIYTKTLTDNTTTLVESVDPALYQTVWLFYSLTRGTAIKSGVIIFAGNGTDDTSAEYGVNELGTMGISFVTDSVGSQLNLKATLTSTGVNAQIKYRLMKIAP